MENFADRLLGKIQEMKSPVVAGLDPNYDKIPDCIKKKYKSVGSALFAFNKGLIDALYDVVPAVKPQLAYYEMYGIAGLIAFKATVDYAKSKGMIVIADGKRNDIGTTSEAYAKAYLETLETESIVEDANMPIKEGAFDCDALTVNPYLGADGILPFVKLCEANGRGIFSLVKTSNKSSGQLQDLKTENGLTISETVATLVDEWGASCVGKMGYSSVGAVVGATYPEEAENLRKKMPRAIILVPGYGAQGGDARSVSVNFNKDGLGAIVNASRSIMYAYKADKRAGKFTEEQYALAARDEAAEMSKAIMAAIS